MTRGDNTIASLSAGLSSVAIGDIDSGTDGELITWNASGIAATVAAGLDNQVLTSNGAGSAPTFQAHSSSSDPIAISDLATGTAGQLISWNSSGVAATVAVGTATHILTSNGAGSAPTFQVAAAVSTALIDTDSTEAFLVRKAGDAGDVFKINTTGSSIDITGSLIVSGGLNATNANIQAYGMTATNASQSTSVSTGGITCLGGLGIVKNATIGGTLTVAGGMEVSQLTPAGTAGQVLTSNGASAPTYQAAAGGGGGLPSGATSYINNQSTAVDITGLVFDKASIRGAEIFITTFTDSTYGDKATVSTLNILSDGVNWVIIEDTKISTVSTNIIFSITSAGQIRYTSPNDGGFTSGAVKWLYGTTPV